MKPLKTTLTALALSTALSTGVALAGAPEISTFHAGLNDVNFQSESTRIAGHLFLPDGYTPEGNYPAIVVITPASGIKEQTAGIYAEKLAQQGFVTLAFDHRTYGESGGLPRGMENAPMKVEDIKNAVSFLGTVPGVDKERIGELGICSGAGYSITAGSFDTRIQSIATVSGFVDFVDYGAGGATQYADHVTGDAVDQLRQQIEWGSHARQVYFETGEVLLVEGIPEPREGLGEFWTRAADYYRNPERGGQFPTYTPMRAAMSLDTRYAFNPSEHMELIRDLPFLAIVGSDALLREFSVTTVDRAQGDDVELFDIEGAQHFDLYDQEQYVDQAVNKLTQFYTRTLN